MITNMRTHVVLVHPEIHWNTGNAGRSCLAAGATLHLIEPLGFSLTERAVRRAGLDYWQHVDLRVWPDWPTFESAALPPVCHPERSEGSRGTTTHALLGQPFFFTTHATRMYWDADFTGDVVLVFGRETGGLPMEIHRKYADRMVTMPMHSPHVRSLNLSTSVGIALYEVLRQRAR